MAKYLIIVESPNKIKHIKEFVGPNYKVMASVGHIIRLNDSGKYKIGVDYDNDFIADWVIDPKKKSIVSELKHEIKDAEYIFIATDDDNEGNFIAKSLMDFCKIPKKKAKRVIFKEITKTSVLQGLSNSTNIDTINNKASAAITRTKLDKLMGYLCSPIVLTKQGGKSAGRVQSVALKIIVDREKEIQAFKSKEYYEIFLPFIKNGTLYKAQYKGTELKKVSSVSTEKEAKQIVSECPSGNFFVKNITESNRKVKAKAPFITSSLQQECSSKLGYSPKKTMMYAQSLFENGLITYMRTDSTRLSEEFISSAKDLIINKFGKEYYSGVKVSKKKAENVQDAHEAIRCTDLENTPQYLKDSGELSGPELKVYTLIYNRAVASLMSDAEVIDTTVDIFNNKHKFSIVGHKIKFPGFRILYKDDEEEDLLPSFKIGEKIFDNELEIIKKKTNPPSRYSEATLIKKLEELKIGRPSTYATMAGVVTDEKRGYSIVEGKSIKPTEKGIRVSEFLDKYFNSVINYTYTAELEEKLDAIANGNATELDVLSDFFNTFKPLLTEARKAPSDRPAPEMTDKVCPNCGKNLVIRKGTYGEFLACSGFPRCRYTEKIDTNSVNTTESVKCPVCKSGIMIERKKSKGKGKGSTFYGCSNYPSCKTAVTLEKYQELKNNNDINNYDD